METNLYEKDFYLWLDTTVSLLKEQQFSELDLENLIEEIRSMGKSEKRSLESYLIKLLEHLLKLRYWQSERDYNERVWRNEIRNFRRAIQKIITDSPSLKPYLAEIFDECYQEARISFIELSGVDENLVSSTPIGIREQVLDNSWFPEIDN
jgi:hypothetical protein